MASKEIVYKNSIYKISYEIRNSEAKDYILILHGWGANKEIMMKAFSRSFKNLKQIYIDLPGFGKSSIKEALYTKDYAKIVELFVEKLDSKPLAIMGHSFGGKVATLLNPANLILLSSAGIVEKKSLAVRIKIAIFKILKALGLGKFYYFFASKDVAGMNIVMYETLKNVVNEDFRDKFSEFNGRALIFWGEDDKATSLESGELISKLIKNSEFFPLKGDHFFFLLHADFIAKTTEESLKNSKTNSVNDSVVLDTFIENSSFDSEKFSDSGVGEVYEREYKKPLIDEETNELSNQNFTKKTDEFDKKIDKFIQKNDITAKNIPNNETKNENTHNILDENLTDNSQISDDITDFNLKNEINSNDNVFVKLENLQENTDVSKSNEILVEPNLQSSDIEDKDDLELKTFESDYLDGEKVDEPNKEILQNQILSLDEIKKDKKPEIIGGIKVNYGDEDIGKLPKFSEIYSSEITKDLSKKSEK
ncbi:MAG: alpha/beta fold hydrolase [Campylobacter sp.]|nr:alpha/beta fold hydrolase [Campylobacter sp.]